MSSIAPELGEPPIDVSGISESFYPPEDTDLIIPQHISRMALYSACFCLFPNCFLTYIFGYERMAAVFGALYISTVLHWYKPKRHGTMRTIDMCLAICTLYRLTFIERFRLHTFYQPYWMYTFYTVIIAYLCNEYVYYMQIKRVRSGDIEPSVVITEYTQWPMRLLNYTQPNTKERENAYYISMYTHIFFIHLLPSIVFSTLIILSYYKYNSELPRIERGDIIPEL